LRHQEEAKILSVRLSLFQRRLLERLQTCLNSLESRAKMVDDESLAQMQELMNDHMGHESSPLAKSQLDLLDASTKLSDFLLETEEKISKISNGLNLGELEVPIMVRRLDEMAVDVNQTWSRRLKAVEDRVQQELLKRANNKLLSEIFYQLLAWFLTGNFFCDHYFHLIIFS
jgi:hypothetical protein